MLVLLSVNGNKASARETLSTLEFAQKAKQVTNKHKEQVQLVKASD